ncbi:Mitotic spindle checkpoint protein Bub1/Mad3 like protein [Aduncisulcus paluster]|uniref:Mitotic spindle checkpoint protein Bub1/Mad3 like protein n=1 Tax=Aduncisulcus paluster TaxID=2918883 RepID=A0ABQ5KPN2_9EUKA|nr:Mitotic spindle checkpoint protein Bub1/Mad3 like protein [Aduncisulcus paluster]
MLPMISSDISHIDNSKDIKQQFIQQVSKENQDLQKQKESPPLIEFEEQKKALPIFAWENSKENICPRREGRKMKDIMLGLSEKNKYDRILEKKREMEHKLRCELDDPLGPYYEYAKYACDLLVSGDNSILLKVLERCLKPFIQAEKYKSDKRYQKLWLKYADLQRNPQDVLRFMFINSIGISSLRLYTRYTEFLEDEKRYNDALEMWLYSRKQKAGKKKEREHLIIEFCARKLQHEAKMFEIGEEQREIESVSQPKPLSCIDDDPSQSDGLPGFMLSFREQRLRTHSRILHTTHSTSIPAQASIPAQGIEVYSSPRHCQHDQHDQHKRDVCSAFESIIRNSVEKIDGFDPKRPITEVELLLEASKGGVFSRFPGIEQKREKEEEERRKEEEERRKEKKKRKKKRKREEEEEGEEEEEERGEEVEKSSSKNRLHHRSGQARSAHRSKNRSIASQDDSMIKSNPPSLHQIDVISPSFVEKSKSKRKSKSMNIICDDASDHQYIEEEEEKEKKEEEEEEEEGIEIQEREKLLKKGYQHGKKRHSSKSKKKSSDHISVFGSSSSHKRHSSSSSSHRHHSHSIHSKSSILQGDALPMFSRNVENIIPSSASLSTLSTSSTIASSSSLSSAPSTSSFSRSIISLGGEESIHHVSTGQSSSFAPSTTGPEVGGGDIGISNINSGFDIHIDEVFASSMRKMSELDQTIDSKVECGELQKERSEAFDLLSKISGTLLINSDSTTSIRKKRHSKRPSRRKHNE